MSSDRGDSLQMLLHWLARSQHKERLRYLGSDDEHGLHQTTAQTSKEVTAEGNCALFVSVDHRNRRGSQRKVRR